MFNEFRQRVQTSGAAPVTNVTSLAPSAPTPLAPTSAPEATVDTELLDWLEMKGRLHEMLLERLNLSMIDKVDPQELKRQVTTVVAPILESENKFLRGGEMQKLIDELLYEVTGLGLSLIHIYAADD